MISALLAYLRDGWIINGFGFVNRVWCWRLERDGDIAWSALPDGWVKSRGES